MNALPSPLPSFPHVTVATLRSEGLACALDALDANLAWLADSARKLQREPLYDGEHLEHVKRVATYTKQATYWASQVRRFTEASR